MAVQRVAVVGAGTMGAGIAQLCAQSGFSVKVHDPAPKALEALSGRLRRGLDAGVLKGKLTTQAADRAFHAVSPAPALADLAGADLVIEAAPEKLELKQGLFAELSRLCPDALLATNTSSLSVAAVTARAAAPERTLGIHFFNPPVAMRLVEMVRAPRTSPEAFSAAWDFVLTGLRRTPVVVKDAPGFIVNRVMRPYYVHAQRLVGTSGFSAVDGACRALGGVPMGPFELMDLIGLDVNLAITESLFEALGRPERFAPPALQRTLVERGMTGRKAGRGFYLYEDGAPAGENPEASALTAHGGAASSPEELWAALRAAVLAEAERVVAEGTASAADVDTAIKLAMNFPKGPFEWRKESTAAGR